MKIDFVLGNSADPDEMRKCHISAGTSLFAMFAKVPIERFPFHNGLKRMAEQKVNVYVKRNIFT